MTPAPVVGQLDAAGLLADAARIVGLTLVAGLAAAVAAVLYRWYARIRIPEGLAVLAGLGVVALTVNTFVALSIGANSQLLDPGVATRNVLVFLLAALASVVGRRAGDRLALGVGVVSGAREVDAELSRFVTSVGRLVTVELPASPTDVEDIEGYDPVTPETKAALAGKRLVFPRGLTVGQLRSRIVDRLREDHGVGHVDVDLSSDGTVEYLAVGSRIAGIGPTLVPGTAAVAVRADPPYAATPGDIVQLWAGDGEAGMERVATGELRGTAGDVVTLAVDEVEAERLDPARRHRLSTLPREPRADREFASLLRRSDETMGVVAVSAGSPLTGVTVGGLDLTVVAVRPDGGSVETIPRRSRPLSPGDTLYVVARPEVIRRLERAATAVATPEAEPS